MSHHPLNDSVILFSGNVILLFELRSTSVWVPCVFCSKRFRSTSNFKILKCYPNAYLCHILGLASNCEVAITYLIKRIRTKNLLL